MEGGALVAQLVVDDHKDRIANRRAQDGQRPLAVDANGRPHVEAIGVCGDPRDIEIVCHRGGVGQERADEKQRCQHGEGGQGEGHGDSFGAISRRRDAALLMDGRGPGIEWAVDCGRKGWRRWRAVEGWFAVVYGGSRWSAVERTSALI